MAKTALYKVRGADIWTKDFGRVAEGDTVELEPAEARHFNDLGYLAPHIPDDGEEEIGELDLQSPPLIADFQHGDPKTPAKETENTRAARR